MSLAIY